MANAVDSKSTTRKGLRVRVPPSVPRGIIQDSDVRTPHVAREGSDGGHKVGHKSPERFVAIDIDGDTGRTSLAGLESMRGTLPPTLTNRE
jgi:hypothetical protein